MPKKTSGLTKRMTIRVNTLTKSTYQTEQQCWNISNSVIHPAPTRSVPASKTFHGSCLLFRRKQASYQNSRWPSNFGEQQKSCDGVLSDSTGFTPLGDWVLSYRFLSLSNSHASRGGDQWVLTVMTDSVVLRSSDLALLSGGRVEWWKSRPCAWSSFGSYMTENVQISWAVLKTSLKQHQWSSQ